MPPAAAARCQRLNNARARAARDDAITTVYAGDIYRRREGDDYSECTMITATARHLLRRHRRTAGLLGASVEILLSLGGHRGTNAPPSGHVDEHTLTPADASARCRRVDAHAAARSWLGATLELAAMTTRLLFVFAITR